MLCLVMEAMDVLKGSVQQLAGNGRTARMAGTKADTRPKPPPAAESMLYARNDEKQIQPANGQRGTASKGEGQGGGRLMPPTAETHNAVTSNQPVTLVSDGVRTRHLASAFCRLPRAISRLPDLTLTLRFLCVLVDHPEKRKKKNRWTREPLPPLPPRRKVQLVNQTIFLNEGEQAPAPGVARSQHLLCLGG